MIQAADTFVADLAIRYGEDLLRFVSRRVRTAADARDIAQEVYVRLLRLERKDRIRDPQAYLYRVAMNLLHEFELKRQADARGLRGWMPEQLADPSSGSADRGAESMLIGNRLREVMGELSAKCRAVLILHRRDGLTCEEIGARLGIGKSMVKRYLGIGLKHCTARLSDLR